MTGFHKETYAPDSLPALGKAGSINNGKLDQGQGSTGTSPPCPECGSAKAWKDGIRETAFGPVQRYLCRRCGYRFSDPNSKQLQRFFNGSGMSEHVERIHTKPLKSRPNIRSNCQICVIQAKETKNLAKVEIPTKNEPAGATGLDPATIKGKILEFHWWMLKQGYAEGTAKNRAWLIQRLVNLGVDLYNSESIKDILARQKWGDGYKANFVDAYSSFLEMEGLTWAPPKYVRPETLAFIPTETEIEQLINGSGKILGAFLQGLKDTGADPGELAAITWIDIDKENRTVKINHPVKGHNPRILQCSQELINRLNSLPKKGERIFRSRYLYENLYKQRKRITRNLGNPRLEKISFRTFRHWKGTMEYHRTKDILHVQKFLGHKSLQSTLVYIDYEQACFGSPRQEEFTVRVAKNVEEASKLIEVGFEYVTGEYNDGGKLFRKRK